MLVIILVTLVVFGPQKLPMLAQHLHQLRQQYRALTQHLAQLWQQQLNEQALQERTRQARLADEQYANAQNAPPDDDNKAH